VRTDWEVSAINDDDGIPLMPGDEPVPVAISGAVFETGAITKSDDYVMLEDRLVPVWVEFVLSGEPGNPTVSGRIELRERVPQCVALSLTSGDTDREIRQSDLRSIEVNTLVIDLVAALSLGVERHKDDPRLIKLRLPVSEPAGFPTTAARRVVERQRRSPGLREITPELLQRVADVYRANIDHAPTEAVAKTFGVKSRMASTYVQRARAAGYLPPTKQGKKQA
jgi:hypothetical protein